MSVEQLTELVERLSRARSEAGRLRLWSAQLAASIADREERAAVLFDELAQTCPHRADRLRGQALVARGFAASERHASRGVGQAG